MSVLLIVSRVVGELSHRDLDYLEGRQNGQLPQIFFGFIKIIQKNMRKDTKVKSSVCMQCNHQIYDLVAKIF